MMGVASPGTSADRLAPAPKMAAADQMSSFDEILGSQVSLPGKQDAVDTPSKGVAVQAEQPVVALPARPSTKSLSGLPLAVQVTSPLLTSEGVRDLKTPPTTAKALPNAPDEVDLASCEQLLRSLGVIHAQGRVTAVALRNGARSTSTNSSDQPPPAAVTDDEAAAVSAPSPSPPFVAPSLRDALSARVSPDGNSAGDNLDPIGLRQTKGLNLPPTLLTACETIADSQALGGSKSTGEQGQNLGMSTALLTLPIVAITGPVAGQGAKTYPVDLGAILAGSRLVDAGGADANHLDLLLRDISELTSVSAKAAFQMSSDHLGRLQVRLESTDVGVSVAIKTNNEHGHLAVSHAQKQLQEDMRTNGLKVAETSVELSQNNSDQGRSGQHTSNRFAPPIEIALERKNPDLATTSQRANGRFA